MTNAFFNKIEDYRDVEALDIFKDFTGRKGFSTKDTLKTSASENPVIMQELRCSGVRKKMPDSLMQSRGSR